MVKTREFTESERVAIKYLREAGHSYSEIAKQVGCSKSGAFKVYQIIKNRIYRETAKKWTTEKIFEEGGESYLSGCSEVNVRNFGGAEVNSLKGVSSWKSLKTLGKTYSTKIRIKKLQKKAEAICFVEK